MPWALLVVAEGVGTAGDAQRLRVLRCDEGQCHCFGRPMSARDFAVSVDPRAARKPGGRLRIADAADGAHAAGSFAEDGGCRATFTRGCSRAITAALKSRLAAVGEDCDPDVCWSRFPMSFTREESTGQAADSWAERMFELMTEPALLFDERGCRNANPAALRLFGFGDRRFLQQCLLSDLAPPLQPDGSDSDHHIQRLLESAQNGEGNGTCLLRQADGSTFWAEVSAVEVEVDGEALIHVGIRDTTTEHGLGESIEALRQELLIAHQRLKQAARKLDFVAATDPITGLWTAKQFRKLATVEAERGRRYAQPISIIAGTIENIEELRAAAGAAEFDSLWIDLAALVNLTVRTTDAVGRYTPATFAILAPTTSLDAARIVAGKLRHAIASNAFAHDLQPLIRIYGAEFAVDEEPEEWFVRAITEPLEPTEAASARA